MNAKINTTLISIIGGNIFLALSPILYNKHRKIDIDITKLEEIM